ncbi:MAG TPA: carbonic anhydrase [Chloroflexota bacterium]|nr:carbonic anhydrase [Chloroflexota bacterium]
MERGVTSRRAFVRTAALTSASLVGAAWLGWAGARTSYAQEGAAPSPERALQLLLDGNARYVSGTTTDPHRGPDRRAAVASGQAPYATILSCADSRVPPELVFDAGLGDLFVHRVAGNVLNDELLGSIEYGAQYLHAPLVLVLGHEACGAVDATIAALTQGARFDGEIPSLARAIAPAVESVRGQPGDLLDNAIRANVALVVGQLTSRSPLLAGLAAQGALAMVGGYYSLQTGQVEVLDPPKTAARVGR